MEEQLGEQPEEKQPGEQPEEEEPKKGWRQRLLGDPGGERRENLLRGLVLVLAVVGVILLLLTIYYATQPKLIKVVDRPVTVTVTPTRLLLVPPVTATAVPTPTSTPTSVFETPVPPGADPAPTATLEVKSQGGCQKGGVAWHNADRSDEELSGETALGDTQERCWLVGQIWTDQRGTAEVWVFAIPPGAVVTFSNHRGGTAWFFSGDRAAVQADLAKQEGELEARDPNAKIYRVFLPEQISQCPLAVRGTFP